MSHFSGFNGCLFCQRFLSLKTLSMQHADIDFQQEALSIKQQRNNIIVFCDILA